MNDNMIDFTPPFHIFPATSSIRSWSISVSLTLTILNFQHNCQVLTLSREWVESDLQLLLNPFDTFETCHTQELMFYCWHFTIFWNNFWVQQTGVMMIITSGWLIGRHEYTLIPHINGKNFNLNIMTRDDRRYNCDGNSLITSSFSCWT